MKKKDDIKRDQNSKDDPCRWYNVCPMKRFFEKGKLEAKWIKSYCKGNWRNCVRFRMEEKGEYHPDSMLPDGSTDENLR
ncbi:uracil-DNA glycosylase [candidate division WOR-3 bacterium]|nr:uracil-DNA glycosylase [candidate division WOR-3 bacterium]